jgi:hypothetical protein
VPGAVFFLAAPAALLHAQQPTGEIRLQVKDSSGAAMEASGILRSVAGSAKREFRTDTHGAYRFRDVPYGSYHLEISKEGFATRSILLDVKSGTPILRTITMPVGAQSVKVDVVDTTPLAGTDLSIDQVAAPVQTATASEVENSGALELGDFMNRRLNGVYLNQMQGNPLQPDVNFRGYTASPLLGTPEGVSVYLDGVRQNQPFGDVVSWDLIPKDAITEVTLLPGSDPLFGLNTLGARSRLPPRAGSPSPD